MLKKSELKKYLNDNLKAYLKTKGFKKKGDEFVKPSTLGKNSIGIMLAYYGASGSRINFSVVMGSDRINEILQNFYTSYRGSADEDYPPLISVLTKLKNIPRPYGDRILTIENTDDLLNNFYTDFPTVIESFFAKYDTLEGIEAYMNRNFDIEDDFNLKLKSHIGIVLAYVVKRTEFNAVYESYIKSWEICPYDDDLKSENIAELQALKLFLEKNIT